MTRLFHDLTVIDNISIALQAIRPSRYHLFRRATSYREIIIEAEKLLKAIDLWDKKYQLVANLSHGEQRKMEILLALASEPKILLMDEPTAGLAHDEAGSFVKMVKALAKGTTLFFTAHDMDVVFELAHRVIVLYFGQIIAEGTPEQIQCNQTCKEIYLGIEKNEPNSRVS
jgi:branched-chain amino acid transport system ATP-binding protein